MSSAQGIRMSVNSENKLGPCPVVVYGQINGAKSAIIVIQEWWGMNEHIIGVTRDLYERSKMVTLVPDLYRGKVAIDRETAGHYAADLDWDGATQDIDACARYLKNQGIKKVGVTGFCQGGAVTIATVAKYNNIDAAVPFYGIPRGMSSKFTISVPIQCHFGERDHIVGFSSPADYEKFRENLKANGTNFEFYTYPANHAFANITSKENFNKEAYDLSFSRMLAFFDKYLSS